MSTSSGTEHSPSTATQSASNSATNGTNATSIPTQTGEMLMPPAATATTTATTTPTTTAKSTDTVHAGERRFRSHHSLTVPVVHTSVYTFANTGSLIDYLDEKMFWDEPEREDYGRYGNPTIRAVEAKIAALEGAQDAMLLGSGMAAVTATLLLLVGQGDHVILTNECYHSTLDFCEKFLPRYGVESTVVPCGDYEALEAAIRPNTRVIFSESPTNPFMRCLDFPRFVDIARRHKIKTVVDTTFATPINLRALEFGVDIVIQSATKYLAGHNDVMAGVVVGKYDEITPLRKAQAMLGCIADPHAAYLILRGLKTLALRVARHNANGTAIAHFLEGHPKVRRVWYPTLESHPDHAIAMASQKGFGGVVSFEIEGDAERAYKFIDALKIPTIGPSLGGVESLISPLALMGFAELPQEEREHLGIRDELVRFCIGIEDTDDLLADVAQALDQI